jgi:hypothetical protein
MRITITIEDVSEATVQKLVRAISLPAAPELAPFLPRMDDPMWESPEQLDAYFCGGLLAESAAGWPDFYRLKEMYIKLRNAAVKVAEFIKSAKDTTEKQQWENKHDDVLKNIQVVKKKLAEIVAYFKRERQNVHALTEERRKRIKAGADRASPEIQRLDKKIADAKEQLERPKNKPQLPKLVRA